MNPIYVEFYPHEDCDCYKIDMPWSKFAKQTQVLCRVDEGLTKAKKLARIAINEHVRAVLLCPLAAENKRP